nr:ATP-binding protein [uncultured Desulfobacter sp.]
MYIDRIASDKLLKLANTFPAVVISGARQVGKSTLVEHLFKEKADIVVFDPVIDVENARQDPELFLNNHRTPIILDEIQYAPELIPVIKRRIDKDRSSGQYIITGSQQWGVLKSISESLAGRAVFLDLESLSLAEISGKQDVKALIHAWLDSPDAFLVAAPVRLPVSSNLYELLWKGSMPETRFIDPELIPDYYNAYIRTYIERDVRLLANISDFQLFGRFLRLMTALTAQEINHSQLGRELGLSPKTTSQWLEILTATFQWFQVFPYSGNTLKRISGKPKGYIADTGLACTSQAISTPTAVGSHPNLGALFETAVVGEIRKQISILSPKPNLYHWRSHGGGEVDFILERDAVFYPIEIKAKSNPSRKDTTGISSFRKTYPHLKIEKGLVLCPTDKVIQLSDLDYAVPWDIQGE